MVKTATLEVADVVWFRCAVFLECSDVTTTYKEKLSARNPVDLTQPSACREDVEAVLKHR